MRADELHARLQAAGFLPFNLLSGVGDYALRDDSDGLGPYIAEWFSDAPCPDDVMAFRVTPDQRERERQAARVTNDIPDAGAAGDDTEAGE